MRSLRLPLLLLLLLPGLLLPAGTLLRICLCEHPTSSLGGSGCCAPAEPEGVPRNACCSAAEDAPIPSSEDAAPRMAGVGDCRCVLLQIEQEPPEAERPQAEIAPIFALLPESQVELRGCAPLLRTRALTPYRRLRPPPDHQRTLPLLL